MAVSTVGGTAVSASAAEKSKLLSVSYTTRKIPANISNVYIGGNDSLFYIYSETGLIAFADKTGKRLTKYKYESLYKTQRAEAVCLY